MNNKRGNAKTVLLILIVIVIASIILSMVYIWKTTGKNPIKTIIEKVENVISGNEEDEGSSELFLEDESDVSVGGEGSSGGGDGDDSTSENSGTEPVCKRQVSYSITNINKISTCNSYDGDSCTDKTITCYAEIFNRDSAIQGNFKIKLSFIEDKKDQPIESKISDFEINPQEFAIFEDSLNLQSTGEQGIANKEINCFYNTIEIPYEELC